MVPRRLQRLPEHPGPGDVRVFTACSFRARLLGLALLDDLPLGCALLIPGCSSVHTFGMRFSIDIAFLDRSGLVMHTRREVPRNRIVRCRGAAAVIERRSP
ncbi:MAG: DUF192 domain-containing protein [Actinobacteria bacterium]|nr:DUF192 domain-containing protein [Actinomycetota bacterium]